MRRARARATIASHDVPRRQSDGIRGLKRSRSRRRPARSDANTPARQNPRPTGPIPSRPWGHRPASGLAQGGGSARRVGRSHALAATRRRRTSAARRRCAATRHLPAGFAAGKGQGSARGPGARRGPGRAGGLAGRPGMKARPRSEALSRGTIVVVKWLGLFTAMNRKIQPDLDYACARTTRSQVSRSAVRTPLRHRRYDTTTPHRVSPRPALVGRLARSSAATAARRNLRRCAAGSG